MFFGVYNTTNDSDSDTCSEKAEKSSHQTDEAASSQEESAHIAAQNIESEATRNAENQSEKCSNTEKSSSDNHSETGNTDSTNNSTKEIDINVTTELFMKKTIKVWNFTDRLQKLFPVKSVRSEKAENIQKYFLLEECSSI